MIKVAILGYGGIARSHRKGYETLAERGEPVKLVALCDINPKQFEKLITINQGGEDSAPVIPYHTYTDLDEMLETEKPDVVDVCLPTYLHCQYVTMLLERGFNVQSEKPMGLNSEQCDRMLQVWHNSGKQLMIGMCLRFEPQYLFLKKLVDSGEYGKVRAAYFSRTSGKPSWGFEGWYRDKERSGGVALDLHIHDVDMVRFLFGEPEGVQSHTTDGSIPFISVNTNFLYPDKFVTATAEWGMARSWRFHAEYRVCFEKASVVLEGGKVTVYPEEGEPFAAEYAPANRMAEESLYLARTIMGDITNTINTPEDAAATVRLVETIYKSAAANGETVKWKK
ncbi:MAG: Gfo/Idh/MocA family oxidoreductase [Eubacteriales bacterium]|nr:Gfo/Idh/MocA family oxidoreductase [Eubacteriales bacterium]MDY4898937.1 Gfo/Idh/MocA family oxidoreductase [Eubacteriales bacterium]